MSINVMSAKHNLAMELLCNAIGREDSAEELSTPDIDYGDVNALFEQWAQFRSRPDFREHMRSWFMGDDLSKLPPPPEPEPEPEAVEEEQVKEENQEPGEEDVSDQRDEGAEEPVAESSGGSSEDEMPRVSG